jgi:hypothetical protein
MVHLCPFIGDLPIKMLIFNSYVKLPEGTLAGDFQAQYEAKWHEGH